MADLPSREFRVDIPANSKVFCVSHRDDPDGLCSAALTRCATGCRFNLASYEDLDRVLTDLPRRLDWLVVSDLGLDEKRELISRLKKVAKHVLYIDHHMMSARTKRDLRLAKVIVRHSLNDCASVLVWDTFRTWVPAKAISLASYGAMTDPPGAGRITREVLLRTSWNLGGYEGHLLALALSSHKCTTKLREAMVRRLASLHLPHQITPVRRLADRQAATMMKIQRRLHDRAHARGRVAIAPAGQLALGTSAELLLGFPDTIATIVYGKAKASSWTRVSVRGTDKCDQHLGRLLRETSLSVGGSGGGHMLAAGAMIPTSQLDRFLNLFVRNIG